MCGVMRCEGGVMQDSTPLSHDQQLFPAHDTLRLLSAVLALEDESQKMAKIKVRICLTVSIVMASSPW